MADTKQPYGAECFPKELQSEYELVNWVGSHRQYFGRFGIIDLTQLKKDKVERLIAKGFKRIKHKEAAKSTASTTSTTDKTSTPSKK